MGNYWTYSEGVSKEIVRMLFFGRNDNRNPCQNGFDPSSLSCAEADKVRDPSSLRFAEACKVSLSGDPA